MMKMLYAAEVWCNPIHKPAPGKRRKQGSTGFATKLTHIQCSSATFITGALHTTSTIALDTHAGILLMHLAINKVCM
jgi:hypothetical protein